MLYIEVRFDRKGVKTLCKQSISLYLSEDDSTIESPLHYIYTYACHEDEVELCDLELHSLLGHSPQTRYIKSDIAIAPNRSPFIHYRIATQYEASTLEQLERIVQSIELEDQTFKLICIAAEQLFTYEEKRLLERRIGMNIKGTAHMKQPQILLGLTFADQRWIVGECIASEPIWLHHNDKPRHYSTALSTRVARAVANIAVPQPQGMTMIDPCCGIGTVLIEALSMGIQIVGYDLNPLAVQGARENLIHYEMPDIVKIADMRALEGRYDALVLDLPYNLCSVLSQQTRLEMLASAKRLGERILILATEPIQESIAEVGLQILEVCHIRKGKFVRYLFICQSYQADMRL